MSKKFKMGIEQGFMMKVQPGLPYQTITEAASFKRMRDGNVLSFFRTRFCDECEAEMMKAKKYCSERCWKRATQPEDDDA